MTSFTGPTCSDGNIPGFCILAGVYCFPFFVESVAYEFGPNRGIVTYSFPEDRRPEMTEDSIALGFITSKSDAVLLRLVSGTSNDYIELEIVCILINVLLLVSLSKMSISGGRKCLHGL